MNLACPLFKDYEAIWFQKEANRFHEVVDIPTRFISLIEEYPNCYQRTNLPGHLTASAIVVSKDFSQVLLTLHRKLGLWLQLGGHADGNTQLEEVALTEVYEESGLKAVSLWTPKEGPRFFDLDIHRIPANSKDLEHWHYDVRYLVISENQNIQVSPESIDLRWFTWEEAKRVTQEPAMIRQFEKAQYLLH